MKKVVSCLFLLSFISIFVAKADYPVLTVKQLANVSQDSLNVGSLRSPYEGDTVTVTGIVAVPPCFDASKNDYRPLLGGLNGVYVSILRDSDQSLTEFAGLSIIQMDTSDTTTNFRNVKQGDVISINVVVNAINTGGGFGGNNFPARLRTQTCFVLPGASAGLKITENKPVTFTFPKVTTAHFYTQNQFGQQNFNVNNGAPYLRMPVTMENLTVTRNGGDVLLWDESNSTSIGLVDLSGYFTVRPHRFPESEYIAPVNGQKINKIKGYILPGTVFNQLQLFTIVPIMPDDIEMGPVPPDVQAITRSFDKLFPSSDGTVQLDVRVNESTTPINPDSVLLYYSVNNQPFQTIKCENDGFGYLAIVPAQPNGAIVRYYAVVKDKNGVAGRNPLSGTLHYMVKDGKSSISDFVNPTPVPNSQMARNTFGVTFDGIVTTDSNDIRFGLVGRYITVQDSRNPYSAIQVSAISPAHPIFEFKRGDKVRFSGKLQFTNGWTVANPSEYELISSGNSLDPIVVNADTLGNAFVGYPSIEQWRSMLIEVRDIKILDTNAKNGQNTGAFAVASIANPIMQNAFNIETFQSYIRYTTRDTLAQQWSREKPIIGYNIAWVRGTLTSNNQTYSIVPRNNADFGAVTAIEDEDNATELNSYPNPSTDYITFDFPLEGISTVQIINSTGMKVVEEELSTNTLSVSSLTNGQYYATVRSGLNTYRFAFTVIR